MIPQKIKVGPLTFEVRLGEPSLDSEAGDLGEILYKTQRINLNAKMCPEKAELTLCHELLHAFMAVAGFPKKFTMDGEELCERLSPLLYAFLLENREAIMGLGQGQTT